MSTSGATGPMQTVAACDGCGRGYCWVSDTTTAFPCLDSRCGGHIRMLATPECMDDDTGTRAARLRAIAETPGYVRQPGLVRGALVAPSMEPPR